MWLLRTLPLSGIQIALGKIWIHWLLPFFVAVVLEIGIGIFLNWSWLWMCAGIVTFAFISLGMASIGLWGEPLVQNTIRKILNSDWKQVQVFSC
ncbi:ABC-type transport system involved in cytochrome c biogenesis permease component [Caldalkalibacillus uzonensis]|uniref:ABC-type transport system involved in cytochrome c biogenesis permease component n=1 Tax=Caldalkalibacillus uzonensis TaxID=353224 RepID=A0ABU0CLZ0_9BACI|nr:hypothetical protein [Caldalkalibacillus uzonensis]MDQ0337423.1 ABC-type transport system involved in cytochrome c biogenesis permease component [Caldalkalibacillus uzonensis]